MPCSRQRPETVKEFLTTMMHHKLTKLVYSNKPYMLLCNVLYLDSMLYHYFCSTEQKNFNYWTTGLRLQWKFSWWVWLIISNTCYRAFLGLFYLIVSYLLWETQLCFNCLYLIHEGIDLRATLISHLYASTYLWSLWHFTQMYVTDLDIKWWALVSFADYAFFSIHIHVLWRFFRHGKLY